MKRIVSIVLLVAGLGLAVYGVTEFRDSSASVSVGDLELSATDEGSRSQAIVLIGVGLAFAVAGVTMLRRAR